MAGVDFHIIWDEVSKGGSAAPANDTDTDPATADTAEFELPKKRERWKLPKKMEPVTSGEASSAKGSRDPELADALKGLGRFAAGQVGMGHVVSTLENLTKQLVTVYQASQRMPGPSGVGNKVPSPGGRLPDLEGAETKLAKGSASQHYSLPTPKGVTLPSPAFLGKGATNAAAITASGTEGGGALLASSVAPTAEALSALSVAAGPAAVAVIGVTAALVGAAAVAEGVRRAFELIHNEGERLSELNPFLAAAHAASELREFRADFRRAEKIGPDAAVVEVMRSRVLEKVADINSELLAVVSKLIVKLEPAVDEVLKILTVIAEGVPAGADVIRTILEALTGKWDAVREITEAEAAHARRFYKAVKDYIDGKEDEKSDVMDPLLAAFMGGFAAGPDDLRGLPGRAPPGAPPRPRRRPGGIPAGLPRGDDTGFGV